MAVVKVTKENFEKEVLQSPKTVLIDFWAEWCDPCRSLSPVVDEVAEEIETAKVCKVNVDQEPELAEAFRVMSIPMLAVIKDGKIVKTSVGVRPKAEIIRMLDV